MILNKDIDAVIISTPDHCMLEPAARAALAKKTSICKNPPPHGGRRSLPE